MFPYNDIHLVFRRCLFTVVHETLLVGKTRIVRCKPLRVNSYGPHGLILCRFSDISGLSRLAPVGPYATRRLASIQDHRSHHSRMDLGEELITGGRLVERFVLGEVCGGGQGIPLLRTGLNRACSLIPHRRTSHPSYRPGSVVVGHCKP